MAQESHLGAQCQDPVARQPWISPPITPPRSCAPQTRSYRIPGTFNGFNHNYGVQTALLEFRVPIRSARETGFGIVL